MGGSKAKKREKALRRLASKQKMMQEVAEGKRDPPPRRDKSDFKELKKENDLFEKYYRSHALCTNEDEYKDMFTTLRSPLPASFRITSYFDGQASALKKIVESDDFSEIVQQTDTGEERLKVVSKLDWYPNQLAYTVNISRKEIRKSEASQRLHNFLISETEAGFINRQEAVSMIPPLVLDVQPHHLVLDMCAAPGSKTSQIIEMLHAPSSGSSDGSIAATGAVIANDVDNKRCYMLCHQARRLHSPSCIITNHDASNYPVLYVNDLVNQTKRKLKFDRILCDVPCSGDGTLRKNPDIWDSWTPGVGNNFHGLQFKIAKRGLELLKEGGLLGYSTCSLNPQEDETVVAQLLRECAGSVELVDVRPSIPSLKTVQGLSTWTVMTKDGEVVTSLDQVPEKWATQIRASNFPPSDEEVGSFHLDRCLRILPHLQDTGGFFVAVLKKTGRLPWEGKEDKDYSIDARKKQPRDQSKEGDAEGNGNGQDQEGDDADEGDQPPVKKGRFMRRDKKKMGFKEEPFLFFEKSSNEWKDVQSFYCITDDFPSHQLMHRCAEGRKRNIYYLTESAAQILKDNTYDGSPIKFINGGARILSRNTDKDFKCLYRLTQEGLPSVYPFIRKESLVPVSFEDMKTLLTIDNVPFESLNSDLKDRIEKMDIGSVILMFQAQIGLNDGTSDQLNVPICGWRGKGTLRPYIAKNERIHFLRVCGVDPTQLEEDNRKVFQDRLEKKEKRLQFELIRRQKEAADRKLKKLDTNGGDAPKEPNDQKDSIDTEVVA